MWKGKIEPHQNLSLVLVVISLCDEHALNQLVLSLRIGPKFACTFPENQGQPLALSAWFLVGIGMAKNVIDGFVINRAE